MKELCVRWNTIYGANFVMFRPNEESINKLEELMRELSEIWCANWMSGVEFALWEAILGNPDWLGQVKISDEEIAIAKHLSEEIQGWVMWPDEWEKPGYISIEAWLKYWAKHQ